MRPLFEMSRTEKLRVMEALWEDLSHEEDDLPSPAWHQEALAQTEQATATGEAQFIDWEEAKLLLRHAAVPDKVRNGVPLLARFNSTQDR